MNNIKIDCKNQSDIGTELYLDYDTSLAKLDNDFTLRELIPFKRNVILRFFSYKDKIIYQEDKIGQKVFKLIDYDRTYITSAKNVFVRQLDDKLFIEESDNEIISKLTTFSFDLKPERTETIEYGSLLKKELISEDESKFNMFCGEIFYKFKEYSISFSNYNKDYSTNGLVAVCYNPLTRKKYLIKFSKSFNVEWKIECPDNIVNRCVVNYNNACYLLYNTDKSLKKWQFMKLDNNGKIKNEVSFDGSEPILLEVNNSVIVLYYDIKLYCKQEKEVLKITGKHIGPVAGIAFTEQV